MSDSEISRPVWAVVPAAGSGSRMGTAIPKQFLMLLDKPVLAHTLDRLGLHPRLRGIQVATAAEKTQWDAIAGSVAPLTREKLLPVCAGGESRAQSVLRGLDALDAHADPKDWVLVHDAARPCLRQADIDALLQALDAGAEGAILGAPVADTLKRVDDCVIQETVPRQQLWRAFTPQAFRLSSLRAALSAALRQGAEITDEASAIEWAGGHPRMVQGQPDNLKITLSEDMDMAAMILAGILAGEN